MGDSLRRRPQESCRESAVLTTYDEKPAASTLASCQAQLLSLPEEAIQARPPEGGLPEESVVYLREYQESGADAA